MPPLLYPLPTTALLTFSSVLTDPSSSYGATLAEATAARTKLSLALKAVNEGQPGASALAVIEAVHVYLPYLIGIIACLDSDELLFKNDPVFQWRSPLTHYPSSSAPLLPLPSIHSEHLFLLLTLSLALSNHAHAILHALPAPTSNLHMSTEDTKKTTAGLARAVDVLCQAAGVAEWTADNVVPLVEPVRRACGGRVGGKKWPVETGGEAFRGLAGTFLADAHLVAIRKLLLPVLPHVLFAPPGPPLPHAHPSPSLLAKLYLHVSTLYISSQALFKVHSEQLQAPKKHFGSSSSSSKSDENDGVDGEIIPTFKRYLRKESALAQALASKWLGVDAGEHAGKVGEAVSWVKDAVSRLEEMEDGAVREKMKGLGFGKGNERKREERMARKGRIERELEDVRAWTRAYTRMNDTVAFQPLPAVGTLTTPPGRPIFAAKAFKPPPSKFDASRRMRMGDAADGGEGEDEQSGNGHATRDEQGEAYAGKGSYF